MSRQQHHPDGRAASTATGLGRAGGDAESNFHGRGAATNPASRFETISLAQLPDGGGLDDLIHEEPSADAAAPRLVTRYYRDRTRTIINPVDSPDISFKWTINPYRGCEHGCVYCYARPSHEYLGLSSGLDFETQIFAKTDAPALLRRELSKPSWTGETIVMSGITDPYQPAERNLKITRGCLEVMEACRQPVSVITKSVLVLRDLDLLASLARHGAARVAISLTTLDPALSASMEPRASSPAQRLRAIRELSSAGVPVTVMTAPIIPAVNDAEIPALLEAAANAGATAAGYVLLRLPWQNKALMLDWLSRRFPDRASKVESLIRDARDGKLYDATFGVRGKGTGPIAQQIAQTFRVFARRHGLHQKRTPAPTSPFIRPDPPDKNPAQLALFG